MQELKIVIDYLGQFLTDERLKLFHAILDNRTRYITVVLEDIYQPHNASAVLRTSECFGIQDLHVIENRNKYNINPDVVLGSTKWINLIRHNQKSNNMRNAKLNWQLTENEKEVIMLKWLMKTIKKPDILLNKFCKNKGIDAASIRAVL